VEGLGWRFFNDVPYEKFDEYYVLWFHWPHDGPMSHDSLGIHHEDYEPVILVHNDSDLMKISLRPGHKYVPSDNWTTEEDHCVIVFFNPWHHPEVDRGTALQRIKKIASIRRDDYNLVEGRPSEPWFFAADSGTTVYDHAQSILR